MSDTRPLPDAPPPLPSWMKALEHAQARLIRAMGMLADAAEPSIDLRPGAAALRRGLTLVYSAIDLRGERLSDTENALGAILEGHDALDGAAEDPQVAAARSHAMGARDALLHAESELRGAHTEVPPEPRILLASRTSVTFHDVPRASLGPLVKVPDPPPGAVVELPKLERPKNQAELSDIKQKVLARAEARRQARQDRAAQRAEEKAAKQAQSGPITDVPEGFASPVDPPLSTYALGKERARELIEEVAMLGTQRRPQLGDAWRSVQFLDDRLLANVDAFASLGAVALHTVEALILDSPIKDAARGYAATVLLGSITGRDSLAAVERVLRFLGLGDEEVIRYAADGLRLVPHPHLGQALRSWLTDPHPNLQALAIEVLAHHHLATAEELAEAARRGGAVTRAALPALARAAPRHDALPGLIVQAAATPDTLPTAWRAMALSGHPRALHEPLEHLRSDAAAEAARAVALVCDHAAALRLVEMMKEEPTVALVEAVGWCGAAESVPFLIDVLGRKDDELRAAAAYALDRVTGAGLYVDTEIEPEEIMVEEPPMPNEVEALEPAPPLVEAVSDRRDEPAAGSPDTIVQPTTRRRDWAFWWKQKKKIFEDEQRYRRGKLYKPALTLWELDTWVVPGPERFQLQDELVVRTGRWVRLHPLDLIATQEAALAEWESIVTSSSTSGWTRPSRRQP